VQSKIVVKLDRDEQNQRKEMREAEGGPVPSDDEGALCRRVIFALISFRRAAVQSGGGAATRAARNLKR